MCACERAREGMCACEKARGVCVRVRERERVSLRVCKRERHRDKAIRAFRPLFFTIFTLETDLDIHKRALQFKTKELSN